MKSKLIKLLEKKEISKTSLADYLGISRTALYMKLYSDRSFTFEEANKLKKILGLSYQELKDCLLG